jgi:hypothetical protein
MLRQEGEEEKEEEVVVESSSGSRGGCFDGFDWVLIVGFDRGLGRAGGGGPKILQALVTGGTSAF